MDSQLFIITKVLLAVVLGGLIGLERELARKPAGLRTHMLVAGASALLVALGEIMIVKYNTNGFSDIVRSDPSRIVQAIVAGVSFLGAGTIIRRGTVGAVEGLTTAASILFVSGIGIAVALNQYVISIGLSVLVLIINRVLGLLENVLVTRHINKQSEENGSS